MQNSLRTFDLGGQTLSAFLLDFNRQQSRIFEESRLDRRLYRARNLRNTEILVLKCMDGRINLPLITATPAGVLKPFRAAGGNFDLGWPYFMRTIAEEVEYALKNGKQCLVLCTYHFSKGDLHRGCKAFNHDTPAAYASALRLKRQFDEAFGGSNPVLHAIVVGIETDNDTLIFHNGERRFDLSKVLRINEGDLRNEIGTLYPDLSREVVGDLFPLVKGNISHISNTLATGRPPEDLDHGEVFLGLGRGYDWLHTPNRALLVGPWSPDWRDEVAIAGNIILGNLREGRIPSGIRPVLMVSALYRSLDSVEARLASFKARFLYKAGLERLHRDVPDLPPELDVLVGTVNMKTRLFTQISLD